MKKLSSILFVSLLIFQWPSFTEASVINQAFKNQQSDVQVKGKGVVVRILSDDNKGSRHQRFILQLPSNQTILIAHNIDLAPKIKSIALGDTVHFYGEY